MSENKSNAIKHIPISDDRRDWCEVVGDYVVFFERTDEGGAQIVGLVKVAQ